MTRLIDADALKKQLEESYEYTELSEVIEMLDNASTVDITEEQAIDKLHETGWLPRHDKEMTERSQGECQKCDYRKFTENFIDGVVEVMNKNGITSIEQLSEILKGGAE